MPTDSLTYTVRARLDLVLIPSFGRSSMTTTSQTFWNRLEMV